MKVSVILAHPEPRSFNHAIAAAVVDELQRLGHGVCFHDLYAEGFDPILTAAENRTRNAIPADLADHCREIATSDGIVVIHPNWWGQPPAILKGWIDRVLRADVAYRFEEGDNGEGVPVGLLKAQFGIVFNTSNTPAAREAKAFGDPLQALWEKCIFDLCGVRQIHREMFSVVVTSTSAQREAWLNGVRETVRGFAKEQGTRLTV
jgi:NAD(P)H dehydrogenase (quinone)